MRTQRCKGFGDLNAQEMTRFRSVEAAFQETARGYGYSEVRTPTLEYLHLFTSAGTLTSGMLKRVYSFLDWDGWSGERVVLKPDATIPAARLYIEQLADKGQPARLSYVTNTFVFDAAGGKNRERWQCGAELIGAGSAPADAELINLACDSLKRMGIGHYSLRLSHAGLIRAVLSGLGLSAAEQHAAFNRLLDGDKTVFAGLTAQIPGVAEALKLMLETRGRSVGFLKNLQSLFDDSAPDMKSAFTDFIATIELVEAAGLDYEIDFTAGKGFEYYTGFIFRLFASDVNVGGGGRYDRLVGMMGGADTSAAGFGLYIDRLSALVNIDRLYIPVAQRVSMDIEPSAMKAGMEVADILRRLEFVVLTAFCGNVAADCGWDVKVRAGEPQLSVTNLATGETCICQNSMELATIVGLG
ncbi:MAG: histidine--tRNA ligase family protein [Dehalococcoidia bacterium]|nr:histidine--tRNA ligase family protein [Dehalococcoidia bacterium]